ncbi:hypothetical protein [Paenibacillus sp. 481]|nr:hypothetical protein [Paenibacillus sp. 481]UHA73175.1 hypothetical protein KIK04_21715 [Paenibacillus sp. 481]
MEKYFLNWIVENKEKIESMGIKIDELVSGEDEYSEASTRTDFLSSNKL